MSRGGAPRGTSWGHTLRRLTPTERVLNTERGWPCRAGECAHPPAYESGYEYLGPKGKATTARRALCGEHAGRYADKHGIDLTAVDAAGADR